MTLENSNVITKYRHRLIQYELHISNNYANYKYTEYTTRLKMLRQMQEFKHNIVFLSLWTCA